MHYKTRQPALIFPTS